MLGGGVHYIYIYKGWEAEHTRRTGRDTYAWDEMEFNCIVELK